MSHAVLRPVDILVLWRWEAIRVGVRGADMKDGMALSTFERRPLYTTTIP